MQKAHTYVHPEVPGPPFEIPPPLCNLPRRGGHCHFTVLLGNVYCGGLCSHLSHTVLALLSHYSESVTCVYSVMFSLQRRCTGGCVPFSDPRCFLPVTVYGTTQAHLVHMCWPLLWGLEIPLQSSPPGGGDRRALRGDISRGGGGGRVPAGILPQP